MSWHGSLTCSYCYEKGHTRRKCPSMKKRADEYQKHIDNGTTDQAEWYQRSAHREWNEQQATLKESNKVCAFCGEKGHRVGTCPQRMEYVQQLKELDEWFIPIVKSVISDYGLGIGAMVKGSGYIGNKYQSEIPYMITGASHDKGSRGQLSVVNLWSDKFARLEVTCMVTMQKRGMGLPDDFRWRLVQKLWEVLDLPKGYDFEERQYRQSEYTTENRVTTMIGYIPFPSRYEDYKAPVVSVCSEPFGNNDTDGWNYSQKREVNRLFRDSKNALIEQSMRYKVGNLHEELKKRGLL